MKVTVKPKKYNQPHRLNAAWKKDVPPGVAIPDIRERLQQHVDALGVERFRKGAAVAALLTVELTPETGEVISPDVEAKLLETVEAWVAEWGGSGAVAARTRWSVPERRTPRSRPATRHQAQVEQPTRAVLLLELIVAPVRPEMRDGCETRRVVSLNKTFTELAVSTLGPEAKARHAKALEASCRAHLARSLPGLNVAPHRSSAPQESEMIRLRREELEREAAALEARRAEIPNFVEQVTEVLNAIEDNVIYMDQNGKLARRGDFRLSDPSRAHFVQHQSTYTAVLKNPSFAQAMRLMLQMVLGRLAEDPPEAANIAVEPHADEEAS